ncbi:MAG: DHHA1 domain-containing protein, partial [Bacteroidota bacterium]|nr:DHHA1 domain-containing protein [Bacteroidota bacterium]
EKKSEGIVKISLRSKGGIDVNQFARNHYNGGGHKNAAGGKSLQTLKATVESFITLVAKYKTPKV